MHVQGASPELLIPASSPEVLKVAVRYGADAVYIGGEAFSLRAKAKNFSMQEMREGIEYAHSQGVKVYVTVNILAHNEDLEEADDYLVQLAGMKPDALLVADPGMFMRAKRFCPDIPIHISTQANNVNYETFLFWHNLGAERVVCGRELSLKEIREIRDHIPDELEIEAFIHGAMCISYSGRCLLSNFLTGRDANHGACTHPCRWEYSLDEASEENGMLVHTRLGDVPRFSIEEESRPGERMSVEETPRGTFIFNSKDLCMIEHIPDMIDAGIDSLKIEGRMKNALYVATVARTYRRALDDLAKGREVYEGNMDWYHEQIRDCTFRPFTTGFFYGKPGPDAQIYDSNTYERNYIYLGYVQGFKDIDGCQYVEISQKNKFCVGDEIEVMRPDGENLVTVVEEIRDENGACMENAPHPQQKLYLKLGAQADICDILRMQG